MNKVDVKLWTYHALDLKLGSGWATERIEELTSAQVFPPILLL